MPAGRSPELWYRQRGDVVHYTAARPFTADGILYDRRAGSCAARPMIETIADHEGVCELEGFHLGDCLHDKGTPYTMSRPPSSAELDAWVWDRYLAPDLQ